MHGLDVDTPFLVLDESSPSDPTALQWVQNIAPADSTPASCGALSAATQTSLLYALPHEYRTPLADIIDASLAVAEARASHCLGRPPPCLH
jgi:hypothetical protein